MNNTTRDTLRQYAWVFVFLCLPGLSVCCLPTSTPTVNSFIWAAPGPDRATGNDVGVLPDGSCILSGTFYDTVVFDGAGPNDIVLSQLGDSLHDIFFAKYWSDGTIAWARQTTVGDVGRCEELSVFPDGSFAAVGYFNRTLIFDRGLPTETILGPVAIDTSFLVKLDAEGHIEWAKTVSGGGAPVYFSDVTVLADDSVLVGGEFGDVATFGAGDPEETVLLGSDDSFLAKYHPDGRLAWVRGVFATDFGSVRSIGAPPDGGCIVLGVFRGGIVLGREGGNEIALSGCNPSASSHFLAKYDPAGQLVWAKQLSCSEGLGAYSLSVSPGGSCYISGEFSGQVILGEGGPNQTILFTPVLLDRLDVFLAKFNPDGTLAWARQTGPPGLPVSTCHIGSIEAVADDSCVMTGTFFNTTVFSAGTPDSVTVSPVSEPQGNMFVAKYAGDGRLVWLQIAGPRVSSHERASGNAWGYRVGVARSDGSCLIAGAFSGNVLFASGQPNETAIAGEGSYFIAKFGLEPTP